MALYGSTQAIKNLLNATDADSWDDGKIARMVALQQAVSRIVEMQTGAVFYGDPTDITPEQRVIEAAPVGTVLFLPWGLRSASAILEGPTWDGAAWTAGTSLTTSQYRLSGRTPSGIYRTIAGVSRSWGGDYAITGIWEDQVPGVPEEIDYVVNFVAAEAFKEEQASPAGFVGPDGAVVPIRNALANPKVRAILDHYRIGPGAWFG